MNFLYPQIPQRCWRALLGIAVLGSGIAGLYGIIHDQFTFSISPEYFTRMKFAQFRWADVGLPERAFVGEIGFLATWWIGLIAGWVLGRISANAVEPKEMFRDAFRGFEIIIGCALAAAVIAFGYGKIQGVRVATSVLAGFATALGVSDVPAFVRVAYIHNAGYFGGVIGIVTAAMLLARKSHQPQR